VHEVTPSLDALTVVQAWATAATAAPGRRGVVPRG